MMFVSVPVLLAVGFAHGPSFRAAASLPRVSRPVVAQVPETSSATSATTPDVVGTVVPTFTSDASREAAATLNATTLRRAEFWDNRTATLLDVINVIGRWESAEQWKVRTQFKEVEKTRQENEDQAETLKRYEMAQRMGMAERVALRQNAQSLPFSDEALAASVGMTVDDFNSVPVNANACDILFDALAESRSGLIAPDVLDARRRCMLTEEGGFNELEFRLRLYKARSLVIFAWFLFGKGNFIWVLVAAQFLHDARPDLFPTPKDLGLFKIGTFI